MIKKNKKNSVCLCRLEIKALAGVKVSCMVFGAWRPKAGGLLAVDSHASFLLDKPWVKIRYGDVAEVTGRGLQGLFTSSVRSFNSSVSLCIFISSRHTALLGLRRAGDLLFALETGIV